MDRPSRSQRIIPIYVTDSGACTTAGNNTGAAATAAAAGLTLYYSQNPRRFNFAKGNEETLRPAADAMEQFSCPFEDEWSEDRPTRRNI